MRCFACFQKIELQGKQSPCSMWTGAQKTAAAFFAIADFLMRPALAGICWTFGGCKIEKNIHSPLNGKSGKRLLGQDKAHTRIGTEARTRRGNVDDLGSQESFELFSSHGHLERCSTQQLWCCEELEAELEEFYDYTGSTRFLGTIWSIGHIFGTISMCSDCLLFACRWDHRAYHWPSAESGVAWRQFFSQRTTLQGEERKLKGYEVLSQLHTAGLAISDLEQTVPTQLSIFYPGVSEQFWRDVLRSIFRFFDEDRDGFLSHKDMVRLSL